MLPLFAIEPQFLFVNFSSGLQDGGGSTVATQAEPIFTRDEIRNKPTYVSEILGCMSRLEGKGKKKSLTMVQVVVKISRESFLLGGFAGRAGLHSGVVCAA